MDEAIFKLTVFLGMMVAGGLGVKPFVDWLREQIRVPHISADNETQCAWEELTARKDKAGQWIGYFERLIFFGALLFAPEEAPKVIGAWLAFKVAAKWEAWNHMGHVPDEIKGVAPLRLAIARRIWAAQGYATFVIGTSVNFLLAVGAAALARFGWAWLRC